MHIKRPSEQQVEHLVVLPQQVGSNRRREIGNTPKEVLVVGGCPGVTALLQAFLDNLEHILDVALDFDVDRAGNSPKCPHD